MPMGGGALWYWVAQLSCTVVGADFPAKPTIVWKGAETQIQFPKASATPIYYPNGLPKHRSGPYRPRDIKAYKKMQAEKTRTSVGRRDPEHYSHVHKDIWRTAHEEGILIDNHLKPPPKAGWYPSGATQQLTEEERLGIATIAPKEEKSNSRRNSDGSSEDTKKKGFDYTNDNGPDDTKNSGFDDDVSNLGEDLVTSKSSMTSGPSPPRMISADQGARAPQALLIGSELPVGSAKARKDWIGDQKQSKQKWKERVPELREKAGISAGFIGSINTRTDEEGHLILIPQSKSGIKSLDALSNTLRRTRAKAREELYNGDGHSILPDGAGSAPRKGAVVTPETSYYPVSEGVQVNGASAKDSVDQMNAIAEERERREEMNDEERKALHARILETEEQAGDRSANSKEESEPSKGEKTEPAGKSDVREKISERSESIEKAGEKPDAKAEATEKSEASAKSESNQAEKSSENSESRATDPKEEKPSHKSSESSHKEDQSSSEKDSGNKSEKEAESKSSAKEIENKSSEEKPVEKKSSDEDPATEKKADAKEEHNSESKSNETGSEFEEKPTGKHAVKNPASKSESEEKSTSSEEKPGAKEESMSTKKEAKTEVEKTDETVKEVTLKTRTEAPDDEAPSKSHLEGKTNAHSEEKVAHSEEKSAHFEKKPAHAEEKGSDRSEGSLAKESEKGPHEIEKTTHETEKPTHETEESGAVKAKPSAPSEGNHPTSAHDSDEETEGKEKEKKAEVEKGDSKSEKQDAKSESKSEADTSRSEETKSEHLKSEDTKAEENASKKKPAADESRSEELSHSSSKHSSTAEHGSSEHGSSSKYFPSSEHSPRERTSKSSAHSDSELAHQTPKLEKPKSDSSADEAETGDHKESAHVDSNESEEHHAQGKSSRGKPYDAYSSSTHGNAKAHEVVANEEHAISNREEHATSNPGESKVHSQSNAHAESSVHSEEGESHIASSNAHAESTEGHASSAALSAHSSHSSHVGIGSHSSAANTAPSDHDHTGHEHAASGDQHGTIVHHEIPEHHANAPMSASRPNHSRGKAHEGAESGELESVEDDADDKEKNTFADANNVQTKSCFDDPIFKDTQGLACKEWTREDCRNPSMKYTEKAMLEVRAHCRRKCRTCHKPPECVDDPKFTDVKGQSCSAWNAVECQKTHLSGYTSQGLSSVRRHCQRTCGLCKTHERCEDNDEYADENGRTCHGYAMLSLRVSNVCVAENATKLKLTEVEVYKLRAACPRACGLCQPDPEGQHGSISSSSTRREHGSSSREERSSNHEGNNRDEGHGNADGRMKSRYKSSHLTHSLTQSHAPQSAEAAFHGNHPVDTTTVKDEIHGYKHSTNDEQAETSDQPLVVIHYIRPQMERVSARMKNLNPDKGGVTCCIGAAVTGGQSPGANTCKQSNSETFRFDFSKSSYGLEAGVKYRLTCRHQAQPTEPVFEKFEMPKEEAVKSSDSPSKSKQYISPSRTSAAKEVEHDAGGGWGSMILYLLFGTAVYYACFKGNNSKVIFSKLGIVDSDDEMETRRYVGRTHHRYEPPSIYGNSRHHYAEL